MTAPTAGARQERRRVDGVLLLDKPPGLSSNAALQRARWLYRAQKAGHTGTLDPLATGLLPLCFGEAAKFAQVLLDAAKGYRATVRFGTSTTTGDAAGETVAQGSVPPSAAAIEHVLPRFRGPIQQVPPRYAALKHEGRNYYEYARAGIEIPRAAREVTIEALDLVAWSPPEATLDVRCSKGTYVRVLAEDLALALSTVAHLSGLRRTASGPFRLDDAVTLDALASLSEAARDDVLLAVDSPLAGMPRLRLSTDVVDALVHGRAAVAPRHASGRLAAYDPFQRFVGVVEARDGLLTAVRIVRTELQPTGAEIGALTLES